MEAVSRCITTDEMVPSKLELRYGGVTLDTLKPLVEKIKARPEPVSIKDKLTFYYKVI